MRILFWLQLLVLVSAQLLPRGLKTTTKKRVVAVKTITAHVAPAKVTTGHVKAASTRRIPTAAHTTTKHTVAKAKTTTKHTTKTTTKKQTTKTTTKKHTTVKAPAPKPTSKTTTTKPTISAQNNGAIGDTSETSTVPKKTTTTKPKTSASPSPTPACSSYSIRREWRDLSFGQKQAYIDALNTMRGKASQYGQPSRYHDFGYIHARYVNQAHGLPVFLPWHREFLRQFEEELQLINPDVTIPYWDWGYNAASPLSNTDMFSSNYYSFGTRGYGNPPCLVDGFCANWLDRDYQCLTRAYNPVGLAFTDDVDLSPIIFSGTNFDTVAGTIEAAHNQVHDYIGGSNYPNRSGDMFPVDRSTNDPLFFLHHSNVDRLWWSWQQNRPVEGAKYSSRASMSDLLPGLTYNNQRIDVQSVLDSMGGDQWCIQYAPFSRGLPLTRSSLTVGLSAFNSFSQVKGTGSNKTLVKHVQKPVSSSWIKKNAMDLKKDSKKMEENVRANEKYLSVVTSQFEKEMNAFFKYNPQSSFAEAFQYTIDNWDWKPVSKAVVATKS
ncbi:hypothetical protein HDU81_008785 [Chytriomyces hyalinus]|nr:hypothetical protein HDU81_008785 [Chytriomyces hyalinus]